MSDNSDRWRSAERRMATAIAKELKRNRQHDDALALTFITSLVAAGRLIDSAIAAGAIVDMPRLESMAICHLTAAMRGEPEPGMLAS